MLGHRRVTPQDKFTSNLSYTCEKRDTVRAMREKCLAQKNNVMTLARAQTQST